MPRFVDLTYALRSLRSAPALTATVVVTLALGIGAATALWSVVDHVLLRPLGYADAEDLVLIWETNEERGFTHMNVSPPNFADWRRDSETLTDLVAWNEQSVTLGSDPPERLRAVSVSGGTFPLLGVAPMLGPGFTDLDDRPGAAPTAVLSHRVWRERFGADPEMIGRNVELNGERHEVVGVMPADFDYPPPVALEGMTGSEPVAVWTPLRIDFSQAQRGARYLTVLGRLESDATLESATGDLLRIVDGLAQEHPDSNGGWGTRLEPLQAHVTGPVRTTLWLLLAAVGLVMLMVCANVANLLLVRGVSRQREMAIRSALGAQRRRLATQVLLESCLLAMLGGALGGVLAWLGVEVLMTLAPADLPRMGEVTMDLRVLLFTLLLALVAGLVFGQAPVSQLGRASSVDALRHRGTVGGNSSLRRGLAVVQVALALIVLAGAGLVAESLRRLAAEPPGFDARQRLTVSTYLPAADYPDGEQRIAAAERLVSGLAALPGVRSAAAINDLPLASDREGTAVWLEGESRPVDAELLTTNISLVTPGYFDSMGIPVLAGRAIDDRDRPDTARALVINRELAGRLFGDESAVGRRIVLGMSSTASWEVVGVVGDVRHRGLAQTPVANVYWPLYQVPRTRDISIVVDTDRDLESFVGDARNALRSVDPSLPLYGVESMASIVERSLARERFAALLFALFALMALVIAAVGLYGVLAYSVRGRTVEFGLRLALGADGPRIVRTVLVEALALAALGVVVGTAGFLIFGRLLRGQLYEVAPTHPGIAAASVLVLLAAALLATWIPARRAASVDPLISLRAD